MSVWGWEIKGWERKRSLCVVSHGMPDKGFHPYRWQMVSPTPWPTEGGVHVRFNKKFLRKRVAKILDGVTELPWFYKEEHFVKLRVILKG